MEPRKLKVYPSSSGFMWNRSAIVKYSNACPRYLLAAQNARRTDIDQRFADLGLTHEENQVIKLGDRLKEREFVIQSEVIPGVMYSGRCDFILHDGTVVETKASFSDSTLYDVIRKGQVNSGHVAQLVSYLIRLGSTRGILAVGYYQQEGKEYVLCAEREFVITINDLGGIEIDGESSGFVVEDQLRHTTAVAKALLNREIYPRPLNGYAARGPCSSCPMKDVCDKFEASEFYSDEKTPMSTDMFISLGKAAIEAQKPMVARPKQRKKK